MFGFGLSLEGLKAKLESRIEALRNVVGESRYAEAWEQAKLWRQYIKHIAETEGEEKAKLEVLNYLEQSGVVPKWVVKYLRDNAGAVSLDWLLGIAVVVFVFAMLFPMIVEQTNTASTSITDPSTASMVQNIPKIIALVLVIGILAGAFIRRRR